MTMHLAALAQVRREHRWGNEEAADPQEKGQTPRLPIKYPQKVQNGRETDLLQHARAADGGMHTPTVVWGQMGKYFMLINV